MVSDDQSIKIGKGWESFIRMVIKSRHSVRITWERTSHFRICGPRPRRCGLSSLRDGPLVRNPLSVARESPSSSRMRSGWPIPSVE